ncbi:META domain-containing protein [Helicobacter bizzozeronii]|uniref:META domain-containing protein n=1 Tax=Helicobacter bizzozeronii TaxID=56877 RepID=UPI000CF0DAA1|nr:META domain-containing protein [Helicobacter bizzozeronii]
MHKWVVVLMGVGLSVLLAGCVVVRFFDKSFKYNDYRIVRVILGGNVFDFKDLILEAQISHPSSEESPSPHKVYPRDRLDVLQEELQAKIKGLHLDSIKPDGSMIQTDLGRLQADIRKNRAHWGNTKLKSTPMGHVEFDQKQLRIYGIIYCNKYFVSYSFKDDDHLVVEDKGMTRKVCSNEKLMAFELAFYRNLQGVFNLTRNNENLLFENATMQIYLQH